MLTAIATVLVMLLVFGVIIFAIFWLFFNLYMKPINERWSGRSRESREEVCEGVGERASQPRQRRHV